MRVTPEQEEELNLCASLLKEPEDRQLAEAVCEDLATLRRLEAERTKGERGDTEG